MNPDGLEKTFAALGGERPDGVYVTGSPLIYANGKRIVGLALKSRLASIYQNREAVERGGLISYGADLADSYRRLAGYVDKILKGAKPGDLPVQQPTKFELVIKWLRHGLAFSDFGQSREVSAYRRYRCFREFY